MHPISLIKIAAEIVLVLTISAAGGVFYQTQASGQGEDAPRVEQKKDETLREAAIKALEQLGKSDQQNVREAAIKALVDYRKNLEARKKHEENEAARIRQIREQKLASAARDLADLFPFRVIVEIGASEFHEGGRIEIAEVWGTRPQIEVGGQYLVRGKYKLPSSQRGGKVYFFRTATEGAGVAIIHDLQTTTVDKQEGEFTLVHGMSGAGHLHLVLSDPERYSRMFANVYFGTGDNVLRKKSW